jgi:hypothetical protein
MSALPFRSNTERRRNSAELNDERSRVAPATRFGPMDTIDPDFFLNTHPISELNGAGFDYRSVLSKARAAAVAGHIATRRLRPREGTAKGIHARSA